MIFLERDRQARAEAIVVRTMRVGLPCLEVSGGFRMGVMLRVMQMDMLMKMMDLHVAQG